MDTKISSTIKPLSASRVKTLENCSWLYWCNYHLKLPQEKNEGAKKGDVCHLIFEVLLSKNRREYYDRIILHDSIAGCESIERLVKKHIRKLKIANVTDSLLQIDKMILVGLKNDFFVEGGVLVSPEYKFDITSDKPVFRIKGFMDKPFLCHETKTVIIDDFKSSKRKFAGEEQESNLQALFYSFAATQLWPGYTPIVRFIFLQYPESPIMPVKFEPDALLGFKYYLEAMQLKIEGFNEYASKGHFAYDQPQSSTEFKGRSLCGFASHPGKLKNDGSKMWHCPYRFGFDYYALKNKKDGKIVSAAFTLEELKPKTNEVIEKCHYNGCPKHINPLDNLDAPASSAPSKKFHNVLDDF